MCGIAGIFRLDGGLVPRLESALAVQTNLIAHRGPDGEGTWISLGRSVGLTHRRLAIIDLSEAARSTDARAERHCRSPTTAKFTITASCARRFGGSMAISDGIGHRMYSRLRMKYTVRISFHTCAECLLSRCGTSASRRLIAARDRFGIKPFYYALVEGVLYFASEVKALLPFLPGIDTDSEALAEYLTFQYTIGEKTLFRHVHQLLPGHCLVAESGRIETKRYWDVRYEIDWEHSAPYFERRLCELLNESMALHLRADVPVGSYISGGIDSSLMAILAAKVDPQNRRGLPRTLHRISRLRRIGLRTARRRAVRRRA